MSNADVSSRRDTGQWKARSRVEKWDSLESWAAGEQPVVVDVEGNLLTELGANRLLSAAAGLNTGWFAGSSRVGVGNGTGASVVEQTDLNAAAGSSNRWFKTMDSGYPRMEDGDWTADPNGAYLTWKTTYFDGEANFQWNEWGVDQGSSDGAAVVPVLLNRKLLDPNLGTKSGGVWSMTVSVTVV